MNWTLALATFGAVLASASLALVIAFMIGIGRHAPGGKP